VAFATRAQITGERRYAIEDAGEINGYDPIERFRIHIGQRVAVRSNTGIVDEDIDRAKAGLGFLFYRIPPGSVADIKCDASKAQPALRTRCGQGLFVDVSSGDAYAARQQRIGNGHANSARAAGHKRVPSTR
jgi:hypothetical protein